MTAQDSTTQAPSSAPVPVPVPPYIPVQQYQAGPPPKKNRVADVVITSILLFLGLLGTGAGILTAIGLPYSLPRMYADRGLDGYVAPAGLGTVVMVIVLGHVVLYLLALGISIPLMIKRRLAFYVPLVTGVLATVLYWGLLVSLILGDEKLMSSITNR